MNKRQFEFRGEVFTSQKELCEKYGIPYQKFMYEKSKGKTFEEIIDEWNLKNIKVKEITTETIDNANNDDVVKHISNFGIRDMMTANYSIYTADSVYDVISLILKLKKKSINLIDFENVANEDLDKVSNSENAINIFFFNKNIYQYEFNKLLNGSAVNLKVTTDKIEDQLVDRLIIYYLGALSVMLPDHKISIISNDYGYLPLIDTVNRTNIFMKPVENNYTEVSYISNKKKDIFFL